MIENKKTIILIGSDRELFKENSTVVDRHKKYALTLGANLVLIVFSLKKQGFIPKTISSDLMVYPTNSFSRFFYIFDAFFIARKIALKKKISLISTQDPFESGLVGLFISLFLKINLHLQVHTDLYSPYFRKNFINKIRLLIAKWLIPRASSIRVVSERIEKSLTVHHKKIPIVRILPIYVDLEKITEKLISFNLKKKYHQFDFVVVWIGRFELEKNPLLAIQSMVEVFKKYPKVGLIMVGQGSLLKVMLEIISTSGLKENIFIEPWREDVLSVLKTADLCLITSWYEGYGLSIVEAAASGCPIVSTNVGIIGTALINNESVLVCDPGDKDCLIKKVYQVLNDDDLREKIKNQAKTNILQSKVSQEEFLDKYKEIMVEAMLG